MCPLPPKIITRPFFVPRLKSFPPFIVASDSSPPSTLPSGSNSTLSHQKYKKPSLSFSFASLPLKTKVDSIRKRRCLKMMKFSHFLRSRSTLSEILLSGKASNTRDAFWSCSFISRAGISTSRPDLASYVDSAGSPSGRTFVDYTVFKGKAALTVVPILPKFITTDSGNSKIEKKGCLLLQFAPSIGERKYDWEKKQMFALSAAELGSLISLGSGESCEFFHDPSLKTSNEGQVRKSLSVKPLSDDGTFAFSLNVVNSMQKATDRFFVPISKAEFAVIRTTCSFILPHLLGWDRLCNPLPSSTSINPMIPMRMPEMQLSPALEWDR